MTDARSAGRPPYCLLCTLAASGHQWSPLQSSRDPGLAWPALVTQATVTTNLDTGHEPLQAASYPLEPKSQLLVATSS